jgi:glutamyl-tRNA synthetase
MCFEPRDAGRKGPGRWRDIVDGTIPTHHPMTTRISRLAPSPTGALHLGNIRTFLINWALARTEGWTLAMRIEDLDGPRKKSGAEAAMLELLAWLGLDHDGPALRQSDDLSPYVEAMRTLVGAGLAYSCDLTRSQIERAASAPHADDGELRFPIELRPTNPERYCFDDPDRNYRLRVDAETIEIDDRFAGPSTHRPADEVGDFVLWTRRGVPAYQLAVVVDDARQRISDVVRGDDLLPSAARQLLIYRALGRPAPTWWHLPLVVGPDGRRLAKRHGDTRVARYREAGIAPQRIIGLMARWCGATTDRVEMSAEEFRSAFDLARLPRTPITFQEDDHAWLLAKV